MCKKYLHRKCYQKCYLITFSILFFEGLGFYARPDYNINICERMKNIEYKIKNIEFLGVEAEYEVDDNEEPKKLLVVSLVIIIVGSKKLVQFFLGWHLPSQWKIAQGHFERIGAHFPYCIVN